METKDISENIVCLQILAHPCVTCAKVLGIHETSTLHRSERDGVVERVVGSVKQVAADVLSFTAVYQLNGEIERRSVAVISSRCKTTCLMAKQHSGKRFSQKHDGPLVLLGAWIKYLPTTAKETSRTHPFGTRVNSTRFITSPLKGYVLGHNPPNTTSRRSCLCPQGTFNDNAATITQR